MKNNLQVISSLLRLQSRYIEDQAALGALQEGQNRVKSMALIHQNLYQDDNLTGIDMKEYIEKLSQSVFRSYKVSREVIDISTDIDDIQLDVDTVIPLGLILNELITNALKYAYRDGEHGRLHVGLKDHTNHLLLEVADNGTGFNPEEAGKNSFGWRMIRSFSQKMQADVQVENKDGAHVRIKINKFIRELV